MILNSRAWQIPEKDRRLRTAWPIQTHSLVKLAIQHEAAHFARQQTGVSIEGQLHRNPMLLYLLEGSLHFDHIRVVCCESCAKALASNHEILQLQDSLFLSLQSGAVH